MAILAIVLDDGDLGIADRIDDAADDRGLSRSGSAGDSDDERLVRQAVSAGSSLMDAARFANRQVADSH